MPEESHQIGPFGPPASGPVDLLIIAGEHSGDQHAARVARVLKSKDPTLQIASLGGPELAKFSQQLIDLTQFSVVGLVEVLKHIRQFRQIFYGTLSWIKEHQPKQILLVDYPGLNLRLAKALYESGTSTKGGGSVKVHYYIGPQIWAWKAGRRFKMARWLDALGVIFPFETDIYQDTDLPVKFVGHPLVDPAEQLPVHYDSKGPLLILPGSRKAPIKRILPGQLKSLRRLRATFTDLKTVILYPDEGLRELVDSIIQDYPDLKESICLKPAGESVGGSAVITSSGTMSLICALAGIPGCLVYRAHPMTYWMGRKLVKVPYLGMPNLLLNKEVYQEFIQDQFNEETVCAEILKCLQDEENVNRAADNAAALRENLQADRPPAEMTAEWLMR